MEKAVDNLEAMFKKAEVDLNYITRKLEFDFENKEGLDAQHNPVKLLKKVEAVKTEHAQLANDVAAIQKAQKEATDFFRSQLLSLTQMLGKLETQTGCGPELSESTLSQFEQLSGLLGIPKDDLLSSTNGGLSEDDSGDSAQALPTAAAQSSSSTSVTDCSGKKEAEEVAPELSAYDLRAGSSEMIELTQKELMSVSELIRGRVKLEDVNKTYQTLWTHFKEEGNKEALTPKDMNTMGMRVTGATGSAKLKVLRSLKLCSISKEGNVKLLL